LGRRTFLQLQKKTRELRGSRHLSLFPSRFPPPPPRTTTSSLSLSLSLSLSPSLSLSLRLHPGQQVAHPALHPLGLVARLGRPDADDVGHGRHEDLAVTDLAGARGLDDDPDDGVDLPPEHDDREHLLLDERLRAVRRPAVPLLLPALDARPEDVLRRHSGDPRARERLDDGREPPGPDDGLDLEESAVGEGREVAGDVDGGGGLGGRGGTGPGGAGGGGGGGAGGAPGAELLRRARGSGGGEGGDGNGTAAVGLLGFFVFVGVVRES